MGMQSKTKTVGGGANRGTADSFNKFLLETLNSGGFADKVGGVLSGGDNPASPMPAVDMNNPEFAAISQMFLRNNATNVQDIRSRYGASGGAPRGTAAAIAETNFRAGAAPQEALAMGELSRSIRDSNRQDRLVTSGENQFAQNQQMQMMAQIFQSLMQANQIGSPQAQSVQKPSDFSQVFGAIAGIAPYALAPFTGGASLGLGGMFGGAGGAGGKVMPRNPITPSISMANLPPLSYPGGR